MIKRYRIVFLLLLLYSCMGNKEGNTQKIPRVDSTTVARADSNSTTVRLTRHEIDSCINLSINHGDTMAYNKVQSFFTLEMRDNEFLYYSIIMANKYNFRDAYFNVYWTLANPGTGESFDQLDSKTQNLALYYLLMSHELGRENSKYSIEEIFGKNRDIPKANSFLDYLKENKRPTFKAAP